MLVGDDPASDIYVRNKLKAAGEIGFRADLHRLPATASLDELLALVDELNRSDVHDGILVQSPLPAGDGPRCGATRLRRHLPGQGRGRVPPDQRRPARAEPRAARRRHAVGRHGAACSGRTSPIAGRHAVVIGRSDIVGKPMALLLLHANATVTICHSRTSDLPAAARQADILVSAIGRPAFVTAEFVKPGATVVDVGTTRVDDRAADRAAVSGRAQSGARPSNGAARSCSATSIPALKRSPAR